MLPKDDRELVFTTRLLQLAVGCRAMMRERRYHFAGEAGRWASGHSAPCCGHRAGAGQAAWQQGLGEAGLAPRCHTANATGPVLRKQQSAVQKHRSPTCPAAATVNLTLASWLRQGSSRW